MANLGEVIIDDDGNELTAIEAQETSEESREYQPIHQQETRQEEPKTLRAHRQPKRATTVTETKKPPVKERVTEDLQPRSSWLKQNLHYIGLGMFAMALLSIVFVSYVYPACTAILDRWNNGQARITHFDLNVGHNGTSHFIAEYWHNQAIVVEFPQDHPEQAKTYVLRMPTIGDDEPRTVTLHTAYI